MGWAGRIDDSDDDEIQDWMGRRHAAVLKLNDPETEGAGRDAWDASTRDGTSIAAQTPLDLRLLGAARRACEPGPTANDVIQQLRAGARGAGDAILLGRENEIGSVVGSIPALFRGEPVGPRYQALLQRGRDQDRFDEIHYPVARGVGEVAGTVASLVATDGLAAAAAPKFASSAYSAARAIPALTVQARARLAAVGAGVGFAGQAYSDALAGRRSNWRDYLSSATSAAVVASSAPRIGAIRAGGLGGGARYLASAALNGTRPQVDQLGRDIAAGGYLGFVGQLAGESESNRLDIRDKGRLGENLTQARLALDGEEVVGRQQTVKLGPRRSTRPDFTLRPDPRTGKPRFPDGKFGPTARPTNSQRLTESFFPGSYEYYYWMPHHVGQILGSTLSGFGIPMLDRSDDPAAVSP
jgi:hypothetical protein